MPEAEGTFIGMYRTEYEAKAAVEGAFIFWSRQDEAENEGAIDLLNRMR